MSLQEVVYYYVRCDMQGCRSDPPPLVGCVTRDDALYDWRRSGGWTDPQTGETFCPGHIPAQCEWCGNRATGVCEGDPACDDHRRRSEFPAEASNG